MTDRRGQRTVGKALAGAALCGLIVAVNVSFDRREVDGDVEIVTADAGLAMASVPEARPSMVRALPGTSPVPVVAGSVADATRLLGARGVAVSGRYAFVAASDADTVSTVDLIDPANPVVVGSVTDARLDYVKQLTISGRYLYAAASAANRVNVLDVVDPTRPTIVGSVKLGDAGAGFMALMGRYLLVTTAGTGGLVVLDVAVPTAPVVHGRVTDGVLLKNANGVVVSGRYAFVSSADIPTQRVTAINVATPGTPVIVGSVQHNRLRGGAGMAMYGHYLLVSSIDAGSDANPTGSMGALTVVDVSRPATPVVVGTTTVGDARDVVVSGVRAYVVGRNPSKLFVVDMSNPAAPFVETVLQDTVNLNGAQNIVLFGRYGVVGVRDANRLTLVDLYAL